MPGMMFGSSMAGAGMAMNRGAGGGGGMLQGFTGGQGGGNPLDSIMGGPKPPKHAAAPDPQVSYVPRSYLPPQAPSGPAMAPQAGPWSRIAARAMALRQNGMGY